MKVTIDLVGDRLAIRTEHTSGWTEEFVFNADRYFEDMNHKFDQFLGWARTQDCRQRDEQRAEFGGRP